MPELKDSQEISLRELILKLKEWFRYLLSKWKIIFFVGFLSGILGFTYAFFQKKVYTAELSFVLEEKSGGLGAYAGLASQFGFDMGRGDGGLFSGDNILELVKSRTIMENTFLTAVEIDGEKDLLINRFITYNKLNEVWQEKEHLKNLRFEVDMPKASLNRIQDSVLGAFCESIRKGALSADRIDKKISIINVKFRSNDQQFAKVFTQVLVNNVAKFYIDIKTRKIRSNLNMLEHRVDSVKNALDEEMYGAALTQDQNQNPAKVQIRLPYAKKQLNVQILTTLYGELIKNLEMTKLTLMREEPLIQVIDAPTLPLKFEKPGKIMSTVIGGLLGGILIVGYLIVRKLYEETMANS